MPLPASIARERDKRWLGWHAVPTLPKDKGSTWCGPYLEAEPFPIR